MKDLLKLTFWKAFLSYFYRPKRSFGQGNIFTPVCHSVHRGEYLTRYTPQNQVHPPGPGTPPRTRYNPRDQVHPLGPGTPPRDQVHPPGPGTPPLGPGTPPRTRYTPNQVHPSRTRFSPREWILCACFRVRVQKLFLSSEN